MSASPVCLIVSFSRLHSDPRIKRQLAALSLSCHLVTIGYGPRPAFSRSHLCLDSSRGIAVKSLVFLLIQLRLFSLAFRLHGSLLKSLPFIRGENPSVVILNDVHSWPYLRFLPSEICILDAHEYSPMEMQHSLLWRLCLKPYKLWCSGFGRYSAVVLSVEPTLCQYWQQFLDRDVNLVRNMAPFSKASQVARSVGSVEPVSLKADEASTSQDQPIRILHHGAANPSRRIELMMQAVALAGSNYSADFYLTGLDHGAHGRQLIRLAASIQNLNLCDPVPSDQIIELGSLYDVALLSVFPSNVNNQYCMPNKFFEFLQSGLPMVIGPTPALAEIVTHYECGIVAEGFTAIALSQALQSVTRQHLHAWAPGVQRAAQELCWENEQKGLLECVESVLAGVR